MTDTILPTGDDPSVAADPLVDASAPRNAELDEVLAHLRSTAAAGRTHGLAWRHAQLDGLQRMLEESEDKLIDAIVSDLGRHRSEAFGADIGPSIVEICLLYTSPSPRDATLSRMPSSA